ncbi:hypothetical protein HDU91_004511, partial [Kappamyces sp. JEL0680]
MKVSHMGYVNNFAAVFQVFTVAAIIASLWKDCSSSANGPSSVSDMFFYWNNSTGFESPVYVVLLGLLVPLYSMTGYEAAGHMSEETKDTQRAAPMGILYTCIVSGILGFLFIMGMNFSTASFVDSYLNQTLAPQDVFVQCSGSTWGVALSSFLVVALFFAGSSSLTVTSRIAFAMARDGAFPFSATFASVWKTTQAPVGAIALTLGLDLVLLCLNFFSTTAFIAVTSIATI